MDLLDERERLIGRILDHQDNKSRDEQELHAIAQRIKKLKSKALQSVLYGLNRKSYI